MAKVSEPALTADAIVFELERFEPSDGRLTLSGRWFGVRGRRFVRPTLTLAVAGERMRALADLDDKPWAAEDGEPWQASFPWEKAGRVEDPELSVAPDITILLPVPGARRVRAQRLAAEPRRDTMTASWASVVATIGAPAAEAAVNDELRAQPEPAASVIPAYEASPPAETGVPPAEHAALLSTLEGVRAELEEARRRLASREAELGSAQAELAAARSAREAALRSGAQAEAARDDALARAEEADAERAALSAETAALKAALEERRSVVEQLTRQHQEAVATRGAALVMRGATQALPSYAPAPGWGRRGLVVVVLLVIVVAVLILLRVI